LKGAPRTAATPAGGYDAVPYPSAVAPAAELRRLQTMAWLLGMQPAAPSNARVLELGCGTGANLLPLALEFPAATIVACDLAATAIADAKDMAAALGIANLELHHTDLRAVDERWGTFDYIVCHDVFSWVAPATRRRILEIQAHHLAPQGVAFLSHDALPGWHLHDVARDMMRHHTQRPEGAQETVARARAMLAMAAQVQDQADTAYASLIRDEYRLMSSIPDEQLYHVITSDHHRAYSFDEFVQELQGAKLQWLGDAGRPFAERTLPQDIQALLRQMPPLQREPYIDFVSNCAFRRALVCRADAQPRPRPEAGALRGLWIALSGAARLARGGPRDSDQSDETEMAGGVCLRTSRGTLRTHDAAIVEALWRLDGLRPQGLPFLQLFAHGHAAACEFMLDAFSLGAVECVRTPFMLTNVITEYPTTSTLARLQAQRGGLLSNQRGEPVTLTELQRFVVQRLDGRHDHRALGAEVAEWLDAHATLLGLIDRGKGAAALTQECLRHARDHALLIA